MKRIPAAAAIVTYVQVALLSSAAAGDPRPLDCNDPGRLTQLSRSLPVAAQRFARGEMLTILAIGSSSTEGYGASSMAFSYPARLEMELRGRLPRARVRVLNRGVGGEDVRDMLGRIDREMTAEKPDLVLWQVGTNALLRDEGVGPQATLIRDGLSRIRAGGADAVLIDPQYAPKVLRDPDARPMVELIAKIAGDVDVPVFRRFALMEHWHVAREIAFSEILSPDLFHMNDWSYGCLAAHLAVTLVNAMTVPATEIARAPTGRPATELPATPASAAR